MVSLPITLSIIGLVIAFVIRVMSVFPGGEATQAGDAIDEAYSTDAVHQAGQSLSTGFMSVIDEIAAFQRDPDYERAEARRADMVGIASSMIGMFQDLERTLQGDLDKLTTTAETLP